MAEGSVGDGVDVIEQEERGPYVFGTEKYESAKFPYTVEVDTEKWTNVLRELGASHENIDNLSILAERRSLMNLLSLRKGFAATYVPLAHAVTIYTDWAWKGYEKYQKIVRSVAEGQTPGDEELFSKVLTTKRLAKYLQNAKPSDKRPQGGISFADELLLKAINRKLDGVAIHEAEHAAQAERGVGGSTQQENLHGALGVVGGIVGAIAPVAIQLETIGAPHYWWQSMVAGAAVGFIAGERIGYQLDHAEKASREASKRMVTNPDFVGLFSIKPKGIQAPSIPGKKA